MHHCPRMSFCALIWFVTSHFTINKLLVADIGLWMHYDRVEMKQTSSQWTQVPTMALRHKALAPTMPEKFMDCLQEPIIWNLHSWEHFYKHSQKHLLYFSCMHVCPHELTLFPLDDFHDGLYLGSFTKICKHNSVLVKTWQWYTPYINIQMCFLRGSRSVFYSTIRTHCVCHGSKGMAIP
jgi:hypothetical protein